AEMASELIAKGTTRLFLGHLSQDNNFPDLAYQTSLSVITQNTGAVCGRDYILEVNKRENDGGMIRF
ncbi:MAG: MBL fold metallo-hydrolase, partial [Oscillospiraceae bacterium]|nr:MBL fold metallo-hydrolase [Oscillospiraceae bacterium]